VEYTDAIRVEPSMSVAEGTFFVDPAADYLRDHFPGAPTLPGLMMLEAAVRVATSMGAARPGFKGWTMLEHLDGLLIMRRVVPGETLVVRVEMVAGPSDAGASFKAVGAVGSEPAMRARFRLATMAPAGG
jgi:3-hydroxymyristoyl/3-hydroxydecanoyl-(acyl carrier protein) dehydratase